MGQTIQNFDIDNQQLNITGNTLSISKGNSIIIPFLTAPNGNVLEYIRGNGTLATFPTNLSSFSNDSGFLTSSTNLFFKQNGNSFGLNGEIGTNDNFGLSFKTNNNIRATLTNSGNLLLGTNINSGYLLDINGTLRNTLGANFATTSGNVGIGTVSPTHKLDVAGTGRFTGDLNVKDIRIGYGAGNINTNTSIGFNSLISNTIGYNNTAIGQYSLFSNTTGDRNTSIGANTLQNNTTGLYSVAVGQNSLNNNTTGNSNVSLGAYTMNSNTVGNENTAIGTNALRLNTSGSSNIAVGVYSLYGNLIGSNNVSVGYSALQANTAGYNIALGHNAGYDNTAGEHNLYLGYNTGRGITTGNRNTIIGSNISGLSPSLTNNVIIADGGGNRRLNIFSNGNISTTTVDAGYKLDIDGTLRTTGSTVLATTSGNVGIGTISPQSNLHINNSTGNSDIRLTSAGAANFRILNAQSESYIGNESNHSLFFRTNSTNRAVLTAGGNFSIGNISSTTRKFNVSDNAGLHELGRITNTGTNGSIFEFLDNTNNLIKVGSINGFCYLGTNSGFALLNSSGRFILGNSWTDTGEMLQVNGSSKTLGNATFGTNSWLNISDIGGGNGRIISNATISADFGGAFLFRNATGSSEYARITGVGWFGIGTTSPLATLDINGFMRLKSYTTTEVNAISSPQAGVIAYNSTIGALCFYDGTSWKRLSHSAM